MIASRMVGAGGAAMVAVFLLAGCVPSQESPRPTTTKSPESDRPASADTTPADSDTSRSPEQVGSGEMELPDTFPGEVARFVYDGRTTTSEVYGLTENIEYASVGECQGSLLLRAPATVNGERDPVWQDLWCLGSGYGHSWHWPVAGHPTFDAGDSVSIDIELKDDTEWAWVAIVPKHLNPDFED